MKFEGQEFLNPNHGVSAKRRPNTPRAEAPQSGAAQQSVLNHGHGARRFPLCQTQLRDKRSCSVRAERINRTSYDTRGRDAARGGGSNKQESRYHLFCIYAETWRAVIIQAGLIVHALTLDP